MSGQRALLLTLGALGIALAAMGVAAITAGARCDGDGCGPELAVGAVVLPPAMLLLGLAILLLRAHEPGSRVRRGALAIAVAAAFTPLTAFLVRDPVVLGIMAALVVALVYLVQHDDVPAPRARRPIGVSRTAPPSPGGRAAVMDPEQILRLDDVREGARRAEARARLLPQRSVRIMTSMMRLRRLVASRDLEAPQTESVPEFLRRRFAEPVAPESVSPDHDSAKAAERRIILLRR